MNKIKRLEIFEIFRHERPNPKTELAYKSTFELLISVLLSAQATDISVNKATAKLYPIANTPQTIYDLGENKLIEYIKTIGLYRNKAKNIIMTCKILREKHNSIVPDNLEDLVTLPGVGRKTANVVLNTAFNKIAMAVDTHIFRISNRTKLAIGKNVLDVEIKLLKVVPKEFLLDAHHWLILHGRYICMARKPKCDICPIYHLCEFNQKGNYL